MPDRRTLIQQARQFRREATRGEQKLWAALRGRALGVRFYRQHPIGPFIADFACKHPMVVVEIDGPIHEQQQDRDMERQRFIEAQGYRVERFSADDALHKTSDVVEKLRTLLSALHREAP